MPNADAAIPGRTRPPWTADGTVYFYGGWLLYVAPPRDLPSHLGTAPKLKL